MFLSEPPRSNGDLHFRVFGFPVRVHPYFWLVTAIMGLGSGDEGTAPMELLTWVGVVFVSILVHELGHAFLQRRFGGRPWITLYGLGGLASCDDCDRSPYSQIIISLAGPIAGFLLAGVLMAAMSLAGHQTVIQWAERPDVSTFDPSGFALYRLWVIWERLPSSLANSIVFDALFVNIAWGIINLLPIYPLDGGRVSREVLTLKNPRDGIVLSLQISAVAAILMAIVGAVMWQSLYTAIMFGYLAYSNYQTLQAYRSNRW
jgi:stage IV sporulation protein FB